MKTRNLFLALLVAIGVSPLATAQQVMTFAEAAERGLSLDSLELVYPAGLGNRDSLSPVKAIVPDEETGPYFAAWTQFLQGIGKNLQEVENEKEHRAFCKFYYDTNGRVELMFYSFRGDKPDEALQQQYEAAFKQYVATHGIQISAPRKFSQCGNMTFPPRRSHKE